MAKANTIQELAEQLGIKPIRPKSTEMGNLLAAGYQMTIAEAREVIKARAEDSTAYSIAELRKAQAMLEAYETPPTVTARREMWRRVEA